MDNEFYWIAEQITADDFPPTSHALKDPDGLLAAGGDLSAETLLRAYSRGIFPWYSDGQPILWWSPNPRCVVHGGDLIVSRSLRKSIRNRGYKVTFDTAFSDVIRACGAPRGDEVGTWILPEMREAYQTLHRMGVAHSVETWHEGKLVGGLYGVSIGKVFFGESMFSTMTDASKVAFTYLIYQLQDWGFELIDCQVETDHLVSLGATCIDRDEFESTLYELVKRQSLHHHWALELDRDTLLSLL